MSSVYATPSRTIPRQLAQTVETLLQSTRQASDPATAVAQTADQAAGSSRTSPTAQHMAATLDSLINQWLPVKAPVTTAAKSAVLDAVVVSSTLLARAQDAVQNNTSLSNQQFTIRLNSSGRTLELTTQVAIPVGTRVQLQINSNNLATILAISAQSSSPANTAVTTPASIVSPGLLAPGTAGQAATQIQSDPNPAVSKATNANPATANQQAANRVTIEQALRLALPQQDAIKNLLPLLQTVSQTINQNTSQGSQAPWSKALNLQLGQLLSLFPKPQQLQTAVSLKQVLSNSGLFLEPKLLQLAKQQQLQAKIAAAQATLNQGKTEPPPKQVPLNTQPIAQDLKARVHLLLKEVEAQQQSSLHKPGTATPSAGATAETTTAPAAAATIAAEKLPPLTGLVAQAASGDSAQEQNTDVLLRQLSKQLLATLAKTQINQMETLAARQQNSPDNQGPLNSWSTEIPIMQGKHVDNLELNIQQYEHGDNSKGNKKKLWTVMLAFDLHQLGKMNVQLKILDASVAATVWSETTKAHTEVKQHIQDLKSKLTHAGVNVKQVDCKLGLPSKQELPVYNQLVDVVT